MGGRNKVARMVWCLAEALRDIDREALSKCTAIVSKQDERKGFALQRFCCSNGIMQRRSGIAHASRPDTGFLGHSGFGLPALAEGLHQNVWFRQGKSGLLT